MKVEATMKPKSNFATFTAASFDLLEGLTADNSKDWFGAHRAEVKSRLIAPFASMLEAVSVRIAGTDFALSGGAQTMFRMNRDVRFSADKSPYRSSVAGLLTRTGTKSETEGVVYVEMTRTGGWAGGGFYQLPTKELNILRDLIVASVLSVTLRQLKFTKEVYRKVMRNRRTGAIVSQRPPLD